MIYLYNHNKKLFVKERQILMSEITNNENSTNVEREEANFDGGYTVDDPLAKMIAKYKNEVAKYGEEAESAKIIHKEIPLVNEDNEIISAESDRVIKNEELPVSDSTVKKDTPEDEFGDDDLQKEMEAQDEIEQREREAAIRQHREAKEAEKKRLKAPEYKNPKEMGEAIGFQTDKIAMINRMTQMVLKKYFIKEGEIPEVYPEEGAGNHLTRLQCLGELTAIYEKEGAFITPEFENIILKNWKMNNGQFADEWVKENTSVDENGNIVLDKYRSPENSKESSEESTDEKNNLQSGDNAPVINIFTPDDVSSVTVDIDEEVLGQMNFTNKVNVNVIRVTNEQLFAGKKIIENSDKPGIIRDFTSSSVDVSFTLPASGYRCTMTGINWFDALGIADVAGKNMLDREVEQWSMFYKHMKNVSIGEFDDFEDFLKKTKYVDGSVIMWALLTATTGDEEEFGHTCTNEKCKKDFVVKYNPHSVAHINKDNITDDYFRASKASPGEEALEVFHEMGGHTLYYTLPDSKIIIELSQPSAYDMINKKLRIQDKLRKQMEEEFNEAENQNEYQGAKLQYYMGINQFISSIIIPGSDKNTAAYKYTTWDDMIAILSKLSWKDSNMLSPLMSSLARKFQSPIDMYIENVNCPYCGKHIERLFVTNIQSQLLFNASRRYQNTEINLIETL